MEQDGGAIVNDLWTAQPLSGHAFWGNLANVAAYLTGNKPYDSFRQRNILTKEQEDYTRIYGPMNEKGMTAMGKYLYNSTLGAALPKLETKEFPATPAGFEKFWKMTPGISSLIVISDAGKQSSLIETIRKGRDDKLIKSYEIGDEINAQVRAGRTTQQDAKNLYHQLKAEGKLGKTSPAQFNRRYHQTVMQQRYGVKPMSKAEERILMEQ
jgi:hypothetical protein